MSAGSATGNGNDQPDRRPVSEAALQRDLAAHQHGETTADDEPEARAAEALRRRTVRLGELGEQAGLLFVREARGRCRSPTTRRSAPGRLTSRRSAPTTEIPPTSVNLIALDRKLHRIWRSRNGSATCASASASSALQSSSSPFADAACTKVSAAARTTARTSTVATRQLELVRLDLREVQDVADDLEQRLRRALGRRDDLALVRRQLRAGQDLQHAGHADHRCPDLMAHRRQEPGLRPARALRRLCARRSSAVRSRTRCSSSLRRRLDLLARPLALGGDRAQDERRGRDRGAERREDDEADGER